MKATKGEKIRDVNADRGRGGSNAGADADAGVRVLTRYNDKEEI